MHLSSLMFLANPLLLYQAEASPGEEVEHPGNRVPFREWIEIVPGRSFGVELVYDTSFIHSPIPLWVVSSFMVAPLVLSLFVMMPLLISLIATVAQNTRVRVSGFSPPLLLFLVFSACSHSEKYLIGLSYVK